VAGVRIEAMLDRLFNQKKNQKDIEALGDQALSFKLGGQNVEAARAYEEVAESYLGENNLIFAKTCYSAFQCWLKAQQGKEGLRLAERSLQVLDNSGWLDSSMEQWLQFKKMVDELREAGFPAESNALVEAMNRILAKLGFMLRPAETKLLSHICPACGANLPEMVPGKPVVCAYCGYQVQA
jgi:hypothetical protein